MMTSLGMAAATVGRGEELREESVEAFQAAVDQAVRDRVIAGGAWWVERGGVSVNGVSGEAVKVPEEERRLVEEGTIFDVASLTKVVATTPCVMRLVEAGAVDLTAPVKAYVPAFEGEGRERITVRQLLTHTSGLRPGLSRVEAWSGYDEGIRMACETVPLEMPDEVFCYSDINFILLGELVQQVTGKGLEVFAKEVVFGPLGMEDTGFRPDGALRERIAATEKDEAGVMLCGVVHDPTARRMRGVAGHAGLFSTVRDVARYARCVISGGELEGNRVLQAETVKLMTGVATPSGMVDLRALGWDVDTKFSRPRGGFPVGRSFGHTGFTGCCVWLDPGAKAFFVFLSNRLHETDPKSDSRALYEVLGGHASRA